MDSTFLHITFILLQMKIKFREKRKKTIIHKILIISMGNLRKVVSLFIKIFFACT